jgi:hypoxanthine-guanine phosphoribosyltransferase
MASWADDVITNSDRPVMFIVPLQGALIVGGAVLRKKKRPAGYHGIKVSLYDAANQIGKRANFDYWQVTEEMLSTYNFIVIDDVGESLNTYQAIRERLMVHGAEVKRLVLVDKPVLHRVKGLQPDFAPLTAGPHDWLVGEGMNDGDSVNGQRWRPRTGVWAKISVD